MRKFPNFFLSNNIIIINLEGLNKWNNKSIYLNLNKEFIMDTETIRQELHSFLEVAEDIKLQAIYTIIEKDIKESRIEYTEDFKNKLNQRYNNYKNNNSKALTPAESKDRMFKILNTK